MINLYVDTKLPIDSRFLSPGRQFSLLLRLMRFALPVWDKVLLRIIATQVIACAGIVPPLLAVRMVDEAFANKDLNLFLELTAIGMGALAISRFMALIGAARHGEGGLFGRQEEYGLPANIMGHYTMARIALNLKTRFYRHLQAQSVRFFETRPVGEHMFRCTRDIDDAAFLASEVVPGVSYSIQRIFMLLLVLESFGTWLLIPISIYLALFFLLKHHFASYIRKWDREFRTQFQRLDAVLREVLTTCKLVIGYNRQKTVKRWYVGQSNTYGKAMFRRDFVLFYDQFVNGMTLFFFVLIMQFGTGALVLRQTMTMGEFVAISALVTQFTIPFQDAIALVQRIRQRLVPAERMLETLGIEPEIVDKTPRRVLPPVDGAIEFRNVRFSYDDESVPALDGISLKVSPGEKVAIVGPTGAGKSTLTKLLVRLYDPQEGEVLLDGIDVRDVTQASLRMQLGIVMQQISTFTESVERNILYGNPRASRDDAVQAARLAHVDSFAEQMEEGYDTVLGEGGTLSGGQKQRLCIARVLVRAPKVLVLDEATSSLDPMTEKQVVSNIDNAFSSCTRIIVAHNLLSARSADRIYVMDRGCIVESGTHQELMRKNGLYVQLFS